MTAVVVTGRQGAVPSRQKRSDNAASQREEARSQSGVSVSFRRRDENGWQVPSTTADSTARRRVGERWALAERHTHTTTESATLGKRLLAAWSPLGLGKSWLAGHSAASAGDRPLNPNPKPYNPK